MTVVSLFRFCVHAAPQPAQSVEAAGGETPKPAQTLFVSRAQLKTERRRELQAKFSQQQSDTIGQQVRAGEDQSILASPPRLAAPLSTRERFRVCFLLSLFFMFLSLLCVYGWGGGSLVLAAGHHAVHQELRGNGFGGGYCGCVFRVWHRHVGINRVWPRRRFPWVCVLELQVCRCVRVVRWARCAAPHHVRALGAARRVLSPPPPSPLQLPPPTPPHRAHTLHNPTLHRRRAWDPPVTLTLLFPASSAPEEAAKAVNEMNKKLWGGRPLYVSLAQRKDVRQRQIAEEMAVRGARRMRVRGRQACGGCVRWCSVRDWCSPSAQRFLCYVEVKCRALCLLFLSRVAGC
jgi:hypothetical protein